MSKALGRGIRNGFIVWLFVVAALAPNAITVNQQSTYHFTQIGN